MTMAGEEHYIATLVGCALGDALGMPVEGWKKGHIAKYAGKITELRDPVDPRDEQGNPITEDEFGVLKRWTKDFRKGQYTDDTILSIALAESLIACKGMNSEDIAKRMLHEYQIRKRPDDTVSGAFGGTTRDAMHNLERRVSPLESAPNPGGPGNGTAMKAAPLGLYMHTTKYYDGVLLFAEDVAKITHRFPPSIVA